MNNEITVFSDGGSRGNPGPSACGFIISRGKSILFKDGVYLGVNTNNFAEYMGVYHSLKWIVENVEIDKDINIKYFLDSELLVKQLNGLYKVKSPNLKNIYYDIKKMVQTIPLIKFIHVYREKNEIADSLVNKTLDEN